jgi:hypothetical protein
VPLLAAAAIACGGGGDRPNSSSAQDSALQGLSREQIKSEVKPVSPARAESLGIIDSTRAQPPIGSTADTGDAATLLGRDPDSVHTHH